ncbi:hypothetical protein L596_001667 [Steinernema carpocapsae]|uniref:AMP-dependent synthetase/ligase domain-containing protein n=2 Tax=Steinernema carpocapsae TaxID=34508 RepID=A0A4U8ULW3_STECR|nr:hypothetical protein L596_001667 [Steinernema carpocapsae]
MPHVSDIPPVPTPTIPLHVEIFRQMKQYALNPKHMALIDPMGDESMNFGQVCDAVSVMTHILQTEGGVRKGDIVSIMMPTSWRFPVSFLSIMSAGAIVTGAGVDGTRFEIARHIKESGCKVVITDSEFVYEVADAFEEIDKLDQPLVVVYLMADSETLGDLEIKAPLIRVSTARLLNNVPDFDRVCVPIDLEQDLATLFFSSGTTGFPKGVMTTHSNLAFMSNMELQFSKHCVYPVLHKDGFDGSREVMMMYMPLHMAMSFFTSVQSLRKGVAQVMIRCPIDVFEFIPLYRPTTFVTAPSMLAGLSAKFVDCSAITNLTVGAAPTTRRQYDDVRKALPTLKYFSQGYGMTELTVACCYTDFREEIPFGSVGKMLPNMTLKAVSDCGRSRPGMPNR